MAGAIIQPDPAVVVLEAQRLGFMGISLSEWDTNVIPQIQGKVEVGGSLVSFATLETITGSPSDGVVYIMIVPNVGAGTAVAEWTTVAPTESDWDESKNGWYNGNDRWLPFVMTKSGSNYSAKGRIVSKQDVETILYANGNIVLGGTIDGGSSLNIDGNIELNKGTNADRNIEFASDADVLWDESEDEFYLNKSLKVDNGIETDGVKLKTKVIEIGDWNMVLTDFVIVPHGLGSDYVNIRNVRVIIRHDDDPKHFDLAGVIIFGTAISGGVAQIDATNVTLMRIIGGQFDATTFNATSFNRGWVTITYEA